MASERGYLVVWCAKSKRVVSFKSAAKLARSMSAKFHARGGCDGATVWKTRTIHGGRPAGQAVLLCKNKKCKRTGWSP